MKAALTSAIAIILFLCANATFGAKVVILKEASFSTSSWSRRLSKKTSESSSKSSSTSRNSKASTSRKTSKSSKSKRECRSGKKSSRANTVEYECESGKKQDTIDFAVSAGEEGLVVDVKYKKETAIYDNNTKTDGEYQIVFSKFVEYIPSSGENATMGYDWLENEIVHTMNLSEWRPFSDVVEVNENMHFYAQTKNGNALFNFTISKEDHPDQRLSPNKMKIDVLLSSFEWTMNDTYVALMSSIEAKTKKVKSYEHSSQKSGKSSKKSKQTHPSDVVISFDADDADLPFGEYTWATEVEVTSKGKNGTNDGNNTTTKEVVATSPPMDDEIDDKVQLIAFSFIDSSEAEEIYWDPEAGIGYKEENTSSDLTMEGAAAIATTDASSSEGYDDTSATLPMGGGSTTLITCCLMFVFANLSIQFWL